MATVIMEMRHVTKQKAHNKVGLGETPRRLILQRCRYSSVDKFEDTFDTALDLMQKPKRSATNGKVRATQKLVNALISWYCDFYCSENDFARSRP